MSVYPPPTQNVPIFNPLDYIPNITTLTKDIADGLYLQYPVAQGFEELQDILVEGTSTINGSEVHFNTETHNGVTNFNNTSNFNDDVIINDLSSNNIITMSNNINIEDNIHNLQTSISNNNIIISDTNYSVNISTSQISLYNSASFAFSDYQLGFINFHNATATASSILRPYQLQFTDNAYTTNTITLNGITLTNGVITNTLDLSNWSGNTQSVNTSANLTHYLGFYDSSSTGYGRPQKTAGISCNPATNTIVATNFTGLASSSTTSAGIDLTSDDSPTTCFIAFSKTAMATGNALFVDNTTLPLSYTPNSSTLTASIFNGSASTVAITDTNTDATYYPVFVSASGTAQTLRVDITTAPLSYNPSAAVLTVNSLALLTTTSTASFIGTNLQISAGGLTFRNYQLLVGGSTNTIASLSTNAVRINGVYNICIINNGTGNLTINTGLGLNTLTKYTSAVVVPPNNLAVMTVQILSANTISRIIVDAYNVA